MVLLGQNWLHTSHMSVEKSYKGSFTTFRFIVSIFAKTRHSSNVALYCLTKPAAHSGCFCCLCHCGSAKMVIVESFCCICVWCLMVTVRWLADVSMRARRVRESDIILWKSWEQIYSELYVDRGKASFSVDQGSKRFLIMYHNKALLVQELCSLFLFVRGLHKSWIHTQHHPHTKGGLKSFTGAQKHIKIVLIWEWCVEASSK